MKKTILIVAAVVFSTAMIWRAAQGQNPMSVAPTFNGGVFVTPVPGVPFSAVAVQQMTQLLSNGTSFQRKTRAVIARDFRGRIHNEAREVLPATETREPMVLSIHIYDPDTRLNTFMSTYTRVARQRALPNPPSTAPPRDWAQWKAEDTPPNPNIRLEDLGDSTIEGVNAHGYRRAMTLSAKSSGTGTPVTVVDEYWYSDELHLNMVTKHSDPRTGDLTITVMQLNRAEPSADLFEVPSSYKIVDMTPPE